MKFFRANQIKVFNLCILIHVTYCEKKLLNNSQTECLEQKLKSSLSFSVISLLDARDMKTDPGRNDVIYLDGN